MELNSTQANSTPVRVAVLGREYEPPVNGTVPYRVGSVRRREQRPRFRSAFCSFARRKTEVPGCGGGGGALGAGAFGGWFHIDLEERAVGCCVQQSCPFCC
ncbi:Lysophospholipase nte1 [Fusarium oxysporum f. sp. albedinis]|nr:Lysophospholipase nte1 [Fusarium oxysporum f. sp. albedinis]